MVYYVKAYESNLLVFNPNQRIKQNSQQPTPIPRPTKDPKPINQNQTNSTTSKAIRLSKVYIIQYSMYIYKQHTVYINLFNTYSITPPYYCIYNGDNHTVYIGDSQQYVC